MGTPRVVINMAMELQDTAAIGIVQRYFKEARDSRGGLTALAQLLTECNAGLHIGQVMVHADAADGTQASSTLTVTQANGTSGDTVTVAGVVLTCTGSSTPSTDPFDGQFKAITDDATAAAALKTAIDNHPKLRGTVETTRLNNVVTVKSVIASPVGNSISLASSDATFVAVGAAKLASGATGTVVTNGNARAYRFGGV